MPSIADGGEFYIHLPKQLPVFLIVKIKNKSMALFVEGAPEMIFLKASVEIQKPSGTLIPSILDSSPRLAPLPPTTLSFALSISWKPNTNELILIRLAK